MTSFQTTIFSLFLTTALLCGFSLPSAALEVATTPLPKLYIHRTYEYSDTPDANERYKPNLGRAGEMRIKTTDKDILTRFIQSHYKKTCAWEHDFPRQKCVTPQYTGRNFMIGYPLPGNKKAVKLPHKIMSQLSAIPYGYEYVQVENDVVLINASDRTVIDAVTLLSLYKQD